ncbi:MAG: SPOR domain-containing protein [Deltaproteobacteria bacterium]|nr:SPOR domain-containing protein [Deltaproteobacteria bacterium]
MNKPEEKSPARPQQADEPGDQSRAPFPEKPVAQDKNVSLTSIQNSFPYTIQVNSYIHKKDAEKRVENLTRLEYDCFTHSGYRPSNDRTVYRVFVGKYIGFKSAEEACKALRSKKDFRKDIYVVNRRWALTAQVQRSVVHGSRLD